MKPWDLDVAQESKKQDPHSAAEIDDNTATENNSNSCAIMDSPRRYRIAHQCRKCTRIYNSLLGFVEKIKKGKTIFILQEV